MTEPSPDMSGGRVDAPPPSRIERELRAAYDDTARLPIAAPGPLPAPPGRPPWLAPAAAAAAVAVLVGGVYVASHVAHPDAAPAPAGPSASTTTASTTAPTSVTQRRASSVPRTVPPGGVKIELVGSLVVREGTGTITVDLGPRPAGANVVAYDVACLSAGSFTDPFGTMTCDGPGPVWTEPDPLNAREVPGNQQVFTSTGTGRYRVRYGWAKRTIVPLATNARGQTYGSMVGHLEPDLVSVAMEDGRTGYVLRTDLEGEGPPRTPMTTSPVPRRIPVYESDGLTVIGEFGIGGGESSLPPGGAPPRPTGAPRGPMASAPTSPSH